MANKLTIPLVELIIAVYAILSSSLTETDVCQMTVFTGTLFEIGL